MFSYPLQIHLGIIYPTYCTFTPAIADYVVQPHWEWTLEMLHAA